MRPVLLTASSLILLVSALGAPADESIQLINSVGNQLRLEALRRLALETSAWSSAAGEVRQRSCVASRGLEALQAINTAFFACEEALRKEALAGGLPVQPAELEAVVRRRLQEEAEVVAEERLAAVDKCVR